MIQYDPGYAGLCFVIRWHGSVFPKALLVALPNALLTVLLHVYAKSSQESGEVLNMTNMNLIWAGYTSVLGFLMVFRNNQAYTRFWEGASLLNQVRGEWFNAVSTLVAFCNHGPDFQEQVDVFQNTLIRLTSMLYCAALQQVCDMEHSELEIIENAGMESESLNFMMACNDRCEILLQWIQRLIVESDESKIIKIAPPLLTRAFQELSRGIVNLNSARKIKEIPFPFPYAQMITCMLGVHWVVTPVLASQVIDSLLVATGLCFFVTFAFWSLTYIALEIDQPFGEDPNDLPLQEMQKDFNQSLLNLLHPLAQRVPAYHKPMGQRQLTRKMSQILPHSTSRQIVPAMSFDGVGGKAPEDHNHKHSEDRDLEVITLPLGGAGGPEGTESSLVSCPDPEQLKAGDERLRPSQAQTPSTPVSPRLRWPIERQGTFTNWKAVGGADPTPNGTPRLGSAEARGARGSPRLGSAEAKGGRGWDAAMLGFGRRGSRGSRGS